MSDAYVIQTRGETAGIVVRAEDGFQFFASLPALIELEGHHFSDLSALHKAIARLGHTPDHASPNLPAWKRRARDPESGREAA